MTTCNERSDVRYDVDGVYVSYDDQELTSFMHQNLFCLKEKCCIL